MRSKICTVQGTVQENEYGGVSSFARGEILACTPLLKGATPCWGGGTVQLFGTLWMENSLLLRLAYQTTNHDPVPACKVATSKLDSRLHRARGVRGPVGRAVFRVHNNPFQHFGQCSPHLGTGRLSDHAPDVATCILDVHKVRLACRILRQARSCDLHIGAKLRQDEGAANHTLQIVGRCC